MEKTLAVLQKYIDKKFPLIPLQPGEKKPITYQWQKEATIDVAKIKEWIFKHEGCNWAIIPGQVGYVVIDVDTKDGGMEFWDYLVQLHGEPLTAKQITGSGNYHYIFKTRNGEKFKGHFRDCKGIQTRIANYIACEPSIHPTTKKPYKWERFDDILEMPDWVYDQITRKKIAGEKREKIQFSLKYIRSIVEKIRDIQMDYNEWLSNLMSIHSLFPNEDGLDLAIFLSQGLNYQEGDEEVVKSKWDGFGQKSEERTGRSLIWFAKQNGVHIPNPSLEEDKIAFAQTQAQKFELEAETYSEWFFDGSGRKVCRHKDFIVEYINSQGYAVITGKGFFIKVKTDEWGLKTVIPLRRENLATIWADHFYKDVYLNGQGKWTIKYIPVDQLWIENTDRKSYDEIVFDTNERENCLNLWGGIPCTPVQGSPKLISSFEELVFDAIAQDKTRKGKGRWLMQFMAHLIQKPWEKPGVAPVITGPQGGGKGLLTQGILESILKTYVLTLKAASEVKGKFNRDHAARLVTVLDEATWRGDKEEDGILKSRVTEKTITVEEKFGERYTLKDLTRLFILSNNLEAVSMERGNRRFLQFETNPLYARRNDFFGPMWDAVRSGEMGPAVYYYLLNYDISDFDPYTLPYFDNQGAAAKIASAPLGADFWADIFFEGSEPLFENGDFLSKKEVAERFIEFASKSKTWKRGITVKTFWDATIQNIPAMQKRECRFSYKDQRRGIRITPYEACKSFCETLLLDFPENFDDLEHFKNYTDFEEV